MRGRYLVFVLLATLVMAALPFWASPAPEVHAQVNLTITMRDIFFDRGSFSVAPGESVSLTLINAGALEHTFTLFGQADAMVPVNDFNALEAYRNANTRIVDMHFDPSAQDSATFTAPTTEGVYTYVCMIQGHSAGGMHGTMRVTSTPDDGGPALTDPLFLGIIIAVVVIVIAVAAVFVLRRRS